MKKLLLALLLMGCPESRDDVGWDQCLRREMFESCLKLVPTGPTNVKYNDWDEVVSECASTAQNQSIRTRSQVKPECFLKAGM